MDQIAKKIQAGRARIEAIDAQLSDLQQEKMRLEAQVAAYQEAKDYYAPHGSAEATSTSAGATSGRSSRALTGVWLKTMRGVGHLNTFGVDDVLAAAQEHGHTPTKDNIRSQVFNYKNRGWVISLDTGVYKFTPEGRDAFELGSEAEPEVQDNSGKNEKAPPV